MFSLVLFIFIRIFTNSYLNVFQKLLTLKGEYSSIINFYTYLGLSLVGICICPKPIFEIDFLTYIIIMGAFGALGNYFIIKALSCGELSSLAPLNSYKPVVALIFGIILLKEYPSFQELFGIFLILTGTLALSKNKIFFSKAILYRFIALILLGSEAILIKKVILLTDVNSTFLYWIIAGLIFSIFFALTSKHSFLIKPQNIKYQIFLISLVAIMQYSTNYIFSKINVAYALALFQLSTILSVFLGVNIFKEKDLVRTLIASLIMITGALFIILNSNH